MQLREAVRRPFRDWILFTGALFAMALIRAALTLFPFATLQTSLKRLQAVNLPLLKSIPPEASIWAVKAASRYVPRVTCLTQALALESILAMQGIEARMHFGAAKSVDGRFRAHAWVESQGKIVLGETDDLPFFPLTAPSARTS
ncbi:MAG: lasso peptide biosynthesis B2 protein [Acidobacteriota bacterium]|nr:lasso peptide biosynthesis B2 protein [Acidobacteriota bacterium]